MKTLWISAVAAAVAGLGVAGSAGAYSAPQQQAQAQSTPKSWNWEKGQNGKRVPKGKRVENPDGSWREEIPQGKCLTVKQMSADGVYSESNRCN